jgi:hypothetical protein
MEKKLTHTSKHRYVFNEDYDSLSCPPAGLDKFVGNRWREVALVACFILALLISWLPEYVIGHIHKFTHVSKKQEKKQK